MFSSMSLGKKLYTGFGILGGLIAILSVIVFVKLLGIKGNSGQFQQMAHHSHFMSEKEIDHLNWLASLNTLFMNNEQKLAVELDHKNCGLGKFIYGAEAKKLTASDPEAARIIEEMKSPHEKLHVSAIQIDSIWKRRHEGLSHILKDRLDDHRKWAGKVSQMVIDKEIADDIETDPERCAFGKWLASDQCARFKRDFPDLSRILQEIEEPHRRLHETAIRIGARLRSGKHSAAGEIYSNETIPLLEQVGEQIGQAIAAEQEIELAQAAANQIYEGQTLPALHATQAKLKSLGAHLDHTAETAQKSLKGEVAQSQWIIAVVSIIALALSVFLSVFMTRSITGPINRVIQSLRSGAEQVSSASEQLSSSSQSMSEGASEQASSLEEVSSSLEEMSSMTKQNADNSRQCKSMSDDASGSAQQGAGAMGRMNDAINCIKTSADETAKIIKTIDEIAMQTNLLALNAAVEAARAGEAGRGFAVVAEEVRNLAQRSAEAAKNTANLIEESQKNAENGVAVSQEVNTTLGDIVKKVDRVSQLISEVSAASDEQSQGIEQVNTAVAQMDTVTQQNAANAEESASASEELSSQAQGLNAMVNELVSVVEGNRQRQVQTYMPGLDHKLPAREPHAAQQATAPSRERRKPTGERRGGLQHAGGRETGADAIIPLNSDEDLKDF